MVLVEVLAAVITLLVGIITYFKWSFQFWKRRGVPTPEPIIPFGTYQNPVKRTTAPGVYFKDLYNVFKAKGHRHAGSYLFTVPEYVPLDLEVIKQILQKEFHHFTERGVYHNERDDPLSANLFAIGGQKWKNLRTKLTPTFSSGKMKMMFDTVVQTSNQMLQAIDKYATNNEAVDIKEVLACFTTDVIGSCAFGLECNSFKNPDAEFRRYGKMIFELNSKLHFAKVVVAFANPDLGRRLRIPLFPEKVTDFFQKVVSDTVDFRRKNNVNRKDMLQLLINLGNGLESQAIAEQETNGLTIEEIAAQAFVFFIAGFETSSTAMTFCLYELSKNQEMQQKARDDVNQVLLNHRGIVTYDSIMEMKYLGQVFDETLRKYPPIPYVTRECVKDYTVPNTNIVITKGMNVTVPILGIHHDPEYYPNPDKFDPERFSEEMKQERQPFTFMPFGEGPRICIGLRFGVMQAKIGLVNLLRNYRFSLNEKTVDPLVMDPFGFILSSEGGVFLNIERI